jgi:ribosome-associated protein
MTNLGLSKTRRKRQMHELQALGVELSRLPPGRLAALDLPEALVEAIETLRRLRAHEAIRRQMQYIGRLMRQVDAEPIRARLAAWRNEAAWETALHHQVEAWRDALLADEAALSRLAASHPGIDVQALHTLIRNARREAREGKPPRSARALFRTLREQLALAAGKDAPMDTL